MRIWGFAMFALASLAVLMCGPGAREDLRRVTGEEFDTCLGAATSLLLLALSSWLLACVVLSSLAERFHVLLALFQAITPRCMRRALFLGAAGALAIGPASAASSGHGSENQRHAPVSRALEGLRLPDRPVSISPAAEQAVVIVRAGDSLWTIASRHLRPGASVREIAAETHRWILANPDTLGPDANLIFPGQHLSPPPKGKP